MRAHVNSANILGVSALDSYFKISERGSTVSREVRGGIVTFFTMAYIVVLNPLILGFSFDHGCGAHSEVQLGKKQQPVPRPDPVFDTVNIDEIELF